MTKRELLARLLSEPISLEREAVVVRYQVSLATDRDHSRGVSIAIAPEFGPLDGYGFDDAFACLDGKLVKLSMAEADAITHHVRQTFTLGRRQAVEELKKPPAVRSLAGAKRRGRPKQKAGAITPHAASADDAGTRTRRPTDG